MQSFAWSMLFSGEYHDWLVSGFFLSIKLLLLTLVLALPLAMLVAVCRMSPLSAVRAIGTVYVEGVRNIPLLVHMLFWYFGAPEILPESVKDWLYEQNVEMVSALIALVIYTSAYMAEDIRSGIRGIAKEQMEAGRSLGFSFLQTMRLVIIPQSMKSVAPPLISQTLNLWKNTSIAMVIGVAEMMFQAAQVESVTFKGFEPYAFATLGYILVSLLINASAVLYERKFQMGRA
jgi:polar amino acid transport system permease protein